MDKSQNGINPYLSINYQLTIKHISGRTLHCPVLFHKDLKKMFPRFINGWIQNVFISVSKIVFILYQYIIVLSNIYDA